MEISILIKKIGIEIEGRWDAVPYDSNIKCDSSVVINDIESHSSDSDDCTCYDHCDCSDCTVCIFCESDESDCNCYECTKCGWCREFLKSCDCNKNDENCKNKGCDEYNACDRCTEKYSDDQYIQCKTTINCNYECRCGYDCTCGSEESDLIGEIASAPLLKKEVKNWILSNYPDQTNSTCGIHVHLSFCSDVDYSQLMTHEFYDYFLAKMEKWGNKNKINEGSAFWRRLEGSTYCNKKFIPDQQTYNNGDRYTHINYCYSKYGTLEIRLLPAFQKSCLAVSAVREIIKIVNEYLRQHKAQKVIKMVIN